MGTATRATLALVAVGCSATRPPCPRTPAVFPGTPAGRAAADFVAVYNAGDVRRLDAYARRHGSSFSHLGAFRTMQSTLGCLVPRATAAVGKTLIVTAATDSEDWLELTFEVDDAGNLAAVKSAPALPPGIALADDAWEAAETVDAYAAQLARAGRFSGVVVLARDGEPFLAAAFGQADRAAGARNTLTTRFNVASLGKLFTAVAVAQLVEAGKLRYRTTVEEILPDYPLPAARAVTVEQLLVHASGMGDVEGIADLRDPAPELADLVARYGRARLAFPPGTSERYSNLGYVVLGRMVEVVSGQRFDDYLRRHVFDPARMVDTGALASEGAPPATAYTRDGRDAARLLPAKGMPFGCQYSTVGDLLRFAEALKRNELVGPDATARAVAGGYGFHTARLDGARLVGLEGSGPGVSAFLEILPDLGFVVIVLANGDPPAASRVGWLAVRLLAGTMQ